MKTSLCVAVACCLILFAGTGMAFAAGGDQNDAVPLNEGAVPASADKTTAPPAANTADAENPDQNKVICRMLDPATGSRIGARRVCMTQHQWDEMRVRAQREVERKQVRGTQNGKPSN